MNKNIYDTNLVIGPNTRVEDGVITKLEINGKDIPLGDTIVFDTLYAWLNDTGADPIWAYTVYENPKVGDIALQPDLGSFSLDADPIANVGEGTITAFTTVYERDITKDVTLV